ncbi:hypothetical protein JTE90_019564 [Oedothorax gibbosus]|uniref:Uncharacterized protein n=1 Tax=Oedothorax gibbosus TaxID=931172 RepID=A0AAV6V467_9ARAC|nr:hypothetical protein JTE90_019564 [Oedothorax gibbosus]
MELDVIENPCMELREDCVACYLRQGMLLWVMAGGSRLLSQLKSYAALQHVLCGHILSFNAWKKGPWKRSVRGTAGVRKASKHWAFRGWPMKDPGFHLSAFMQSLPL